MQIICWRLKKVLDYEDDVNDFHICVDSYSIEQFRKTLLNEPFINGQPLKPQATNFQIEISCSEFPNHNPKHTDSGFEDFNKNYKESINYYDTLKIEVGAFDKIIVSEISNSIFQIRTNSQGLERITAAVSTSKNMAYIYDNFLPINIRIEDSYQNARLIFWTGKDGDIMYH